jgi:hypothetical protein
LELKCVINISKAFSFAGEAEIFRCMCTLSNAMVGEILHATILPDSGRQKMQIVFFVSWEGVFTLEHNVGLANSATSTGMIKLVAFKSSKLKFFFKLIIFCSVHLLPLHLLGPPFLPIILSCPPHC